MSRRPSEAKTRPPQKDRLIGAVRALLFIPVVLLVAAIVTGVWVGAFALVTQTPFVAAFRKVMLSDAFAPNMVLTVAALAGTCLMYRLYAREPHEQSVMGWDREAVKHGLSGVLLGVGAQSLVLILGLATGVYTITWNWAVHGDSRLWLLYAATMLLVAVQEEAIFRGYLLQSLTKAVGNVPAAVVLAVLFGSAHLHQPGIGLAALTGLALHAMVYAYSVFQTGTLWQAVGLHWAWNVFEGVVFGLPNSGVSAHFSLWATEVTGPTWWTGGLFGPEAGLISALAFTAVLGLIYAMAKRQGRSAARVYSSRRSSS